MKNTSLLFFFFLFHFQVINGQSVEIVEDTEVRVLLEQYVNASKAKPYLSGYRIQLLATTDRRKVEKGESEFRRDYPAISVEWEHARPYYKLRAGAFANKLDATRFLKEVKKDYPSALLFKDKIAISELLESE